MNFVIIASPRTGSTHLVTTLSGHPDIFCNGNIFKHNKVQVFWPKSELTAQAVEALFRLRDENPEEFLAYVYSKNYDRKHVGFKIFNKQNNEILNYMIADPQIRKIILFRRNVLANYSSWLAAKGSGKYSQNDESDKQDKVCFSEEEFLDFHQQYITFYADVLNRLNACLQPFYFMNYEDINEQSLLLGACNFIGADSSLAIVKENQYRQLVKQNSSDILDRFSNPSLVRSFLRTNGLLGWKHEHDNLLSPLRSGPTSVELEDV